MTTYRTALIPLDATEPLANYTQAVLAKVEHDTVGQFSLAAYIKGVIAALGTERTQVGNEIGGERCHGLGYSRLALTELLQAHWTFDDGAGYLSATGILKLNCRFLTPARFR